jgi:hypothetical protein
MITHLNWDSSQQFKCLSEIRQNIALNTRPLWSIELQFILDKTSNNPPAALSLVKYTKSPLLCF